MIGSLPHCSALSLVIAVSVSLPASASGVAPVNVRLLQEKQIGDCIREAADGRAWLAKTLWALRDQEGGWVGAEVVNRDGSHDLGPLQVNTWWISRIAKMTRRSPDIVRNLLIHDPCFNVQVARWIFLSGLAQRRDYWRAVGSYHSPTGWRQRRYARSVAHHLQRRFGPDTFSRRGRR